MSEMKIRGTTIVGVMRSGQVAIAGDGQVSLGETIIKEGAVKLRKLYKDKVIAGFAGSVADAFTLFEKFESQLEKNNGRLERSAVDLAKEWRLDKYLRRLEAMLIVADAECLLTISGSGDVIRPEDGICTIGSGGAYALAAARALIKHTELTAEQIARESLLTAARICIYTNDQIEVHTL